MSCENCEESAYVIDKLAKLLAEIAVIVNGPEPPLTRWSYHDLPEKVRALKAHPAPVAVPAEWPKADGSTKELGWSWDYKWLESVVDAARGAGWETSMEAVDFVLSHVCAPAVPAKLEHEASADCWCSPELDSVDPETGAKVWIHREAH